MAGILIGSTCNLISLYDTPNTTPEGVSMLLLPQSGLHCFLFKENTLFEVNQVEQFQCVWILD